MIMCRILQDAPLTSWRATIHQFLAHLKLELRLNLSPNKVKISPWLFGLKLFHFYKGGVKIFTCLPSDLNSAPEGGIQIMNCVATLLTKSRTKFLVEYHSSCLESEFTLQRLMIGWGSCRNQLPSKRSHSTLHCFAKRLQKQSKRPRERTWSTQKAPSRSAFATRLR